MVWEAYISTEWNGAQQIYSSRGASSFSLVTWDYVLSIITFSFAALWNYSVCCVKVHCLLLRFILLFRLVHYPSVPPTSTVKLDKPFSPMFGNVSWQCFPADHPQQLVRGSKNTTTWLEGLNLPYRYPYFHWKNRKSANRWRLNVRVLLVNFCNVVKETEVHGGRAGSNNHNLKQERSRTI